MTNTTNPTAAVSQNDGQTIAIRSDVKYQYSKNWLRFGRVIAIEQSGKRAQVLWNHEVYCGNSTSIQDRDLNLKTWVSKAKLSTI